MVVKIVEPLKAGLVELFGQGSTSSGALDLRLEEVEGGEHEDAGEDEEDQRRPGQPFPGQVLHDKIEGEVHGDVGQEDEEEDGGELCIKDEQESHAEQSVDGHEDNQKPKPKRLLWTKPAMGTLHIFSTLIGLFQPGKVWYLRYATYLVFDLNFSFALSLICVNILGTHKYNIFKPAPCSKGSSKYYKKGM